MYSHEMKRKGKTIKKQGDKASKFTFKLGIDRPLDFPDTVSSHATKIKPFAAHSDTKNKPGTHCNDSYVTHAESMRIWIPCFVRTTDRSPVPKGLVSVQHSLPSTDCQRKHCEYIGCFSSITGCFDKLHREHRHMLAKIGRAS